MRYKDDNSNLKSHIQTLRGVVGFEALIIAALWLGWNNNQNDIRMHIPPDLRSGAVVRPDEVGPSHVFAFAHNIFQQGNHWANNGAKDYGMQIFRMAPYLTPKYRAYLQKDLKNRGRDGELSDRTRIIQAIPGHGFEDRRVEVIDQHTWVVWLDYHIQEFVRGMEVKNVYIRYPLRVVRYDVDLVQNPWGLALDGYQGDGPRRLTEAEVNAEDTKADPS